MWMPTSSTLIFFALCLECSLVLNASASDAELASSLLNRASEWDCASNSECTLSHSSCVNGFCECDSGYIYNTDMTACLLAATAYGDECTETIQCSTYLLSGSACSDGVCTCGEGYHYTRGRCYASAALGETCTADVNCYVWADNEAASCVNGVCVCSEGFYTREYRTCRRASYAVGDSCAIDLDCQFEDAYCDTSSFDANSHVCAIPNTVTTSSPDSGTTSIPDSGTTSIPDSGTTSIPDSGTTSIPDSGTTSIPDSGTTSIPDSGTTSIPDSGTTSIPDSGTTSIPDSGTTSIPDSDTTPIPDSDTTPIPDGDTTANSTDSDTYETEDEVYAESSIVSSLGRADGNVTLGTECVSNNDCALLANSRCGAAGVCICKRAYYASDDMSTCIPEIGEGCSFDEDSEIENAICRDNSWSCGYSTVASINQQICRKSTKNYNYSCLHDEQCYIFGPDASCQNKRCLCNEGSHLVEDLKFCWVSKGISESCQADEDCYVENLGLELLCTNSVCTCPSGTSPNSDNTLCKDDNAVLGDTCEEDSDCVPKNSACIDSICTCPTNYFEVDEYCAAGVNATCSSNSDCVVGNSVCTGNNVCGCAENYVSDAPDSCLPVAAYGEKCDSDTQCSTVLSNTRCSVSTSTADEDSNSTTTSQCECKSDYHYRFGSCNYKTAIGGSCQTLGDCYVAFGLEDVVCRKGVCACSWDSTAEDTTSCSRVASDAKTLFLSTWLSMLLLGVKIFLV